MHFLNNTAPPEQQLHQTIIVLASSRKPAAYIDVVASAALASILVYTTEVVTLGVTDPRWDVWLKTMRSRRILRANSREFKALATRHSSDEHAIIKYGKAQAIAFQPSAANPPHLEKLAECLAVFPDRLTDNPMAERHKDYPVVAIDQGLGMLASVAASHVADSILSWFLTLTFDQQATWYDTGCLFSVIELSGDDFTDRSIYSSADGSLSKMVSGRTASFLLPPATLKVKRRS